MLCMAQTLVMRHSGCEQDQEATLGREELGEHRAQEDEGVDPALAGRRGGEGGDADTSHPPHIGDDVSVTGESVWARLGGGETASTAHTALTCARKVGSFATTADSLPADFQFDTFFI